MLTPPDDLTVDRVSSYLQEHWGVRAVEVAYAPLGHGSHNFAVRAADGGRWFVKANQSGPNSEFFQATYATVAAVAEGGLDFVLAPVRTRAGEVKPQVSETWELGLFPFIDGRNPDFASAERELVAEVLGRLHSYTPLPENAIQWEPSWYQPELKQILAEELERPWSDGPYGELARALFLQHRQGIERLLALSDELVARLAESDQPHVVTHGEPHAGNTMLDTSGAMHLIDCDAMFVAPRERDLRLLLHASHRGPKALDNTRVLAAYQRTAGPIEPRPFVLELFRAEWHLIEIARYAELFSGAHGDSADVEARWRSLNGYVPVSQNWE